MLYTEKKKNKAYFSHSLIFIFVNLVFHNSAIVTDRFSQTTTHIHDVNILIHLNYSLYKNILFMRILEGYYTWNIFEICLVFRLPSG